MIHKKLKINQDFNNFEKLELDNKEENLPIVSTKQVLKTLNYLLKTQIRKLQIF